MTIALETHFGSVLESVFPNHAELHPRVESDEICIYVDWKLMDDHERPNKRSKKIKIRISESALEDYVAGSTTEKGSADERLLRIAQKHLRTFDPHHNSPAHVQVPVVEWVITTTMLNA